MRNGNIAAPRLPSAVWFAVFFAAIFLLHSRLLNLPYFWDEAGYYVPAARDLFLDGSLIPHSTPSNAHPPLVLAYLAVCWKIAGYAPAVTRTAMLLLAAFSLLGIFRLANRVANFEVAAASTVCTALYPVFFAQSSLAHVDLAAAGLSLWGLLAFLEKRRVAAALWFSLAVLSKETAILAPLAILGWELASRWFGIGFQKHSAGDVAKTASVGRWQRLIPLLIPVVPIALWYAYHYARTGYLFGNPEFFRYNVQATADPLRILLALGIRLWQTFGYLGLYLLTLAALLAMCRPPVRSNGQERERIALHVQFTFLSVVIAYLVAMSVVGGAELARYMLFAVPLVIIICVSTLWRRAMYWQGVVVIVCLAFAANLFVNPPYGLSLEDNLAYRDYIILHQHAEQFAEARYPMARVLTAWPASDEISHPYLGYVTRPMRVVRIEDFSAEQILSASDLRSTFDIALVFSTKYEPLHPWFENWSIVQQWKARFFGYHRDLLPAAAAQILGGTLVYTEHLDGQWVGLIEMNPVHEAQATVPRRGP